MACSSSVRGVPRFFAFSGALACAWLLLAAPAPARGESLEREMAYPDLSVTRDESGRWSEIALPSGRPEVALGQPAVPSIEVVLRLPAGAHAAAAAWEPLAERYVALDRPVRPYPGERSTVEPELPDVAPDPLVYEAAGLFPAEPARLVNEVELSNGARYAVVRVFPVRYEPGEGRLLWTERGRLTVELGREPVAGGLERKRPALLAPDAFGKAAAGPWQEIRVNEPGYLPSDVPSVEGAPVEYAIIVPPDDAMAAAWQPLADWKTACGHPARVVRTDWIDEHYPEGSDPSERIRLFLADAYRNWGLRWALMGGDPSVVPIRYAFSTLMAGVNISTDYYYACLERNWDADGDGVFGEARSVLGDSADTTPEIQVGRVSARTAQDVEQYLEKYFTYAREPNRQGYLDNLLFLGEVLFHVQWSLRGRGVLPDCVSEESCEDASCRVDNVGSTICCWYDGADDCLKLYSELRDSLEVPHGVRLLLERSDHYRTVRPELASIIEAESANSSLSHMSSGYSLVFQVGHGYHDRWAVGDGRLLTGDLARLTNGDGGKYFVAYAVNCHSAAVEYDCFGEKMLLMPGGGSVAYMGCTNADYPSAAQGFSKDFLRFLLDEPGATVGDGFFGSLAAHAMTGSQINVDNQTRFLLYTQILLGEPGLPFWQGTPATMTVSLPDHSSRQVALGVDAVRVAVTSDGHAVEGAQICLHKEGEVYTVGVIGGGAEEIELPFHARTTGPFSIAVTAPGQIPVLLDGSVTASSAQQALHLSGFSLVDDGSASSRGNGNAASEPGERVRLRVTIRNSGLQAVAGAAARLRPGAGFPAGAAEIADSTAYFGLMSAGGQATDAEAFLVNLASSSGADLFGDADQIELPFVFVIDPDGAGTRVPLTLVVSRARLGMSSNLLTGAPGGVQNLWLGLKNDGKGTASHLVGHLSTLNASDIQVYTSSVRLDDLAPEDTLLAGRFTVRVYQPAGQLRFTVVDTFQTPDDTLHARLLDLEAPAAPPVPSLVGQMEAIRLSWEAPAAAGDGVGGYKLYRATTPSGPFTEVVEGILTGHRFFHDVGLGALEQYSYKLAAVDVGGNIGLVSSVASAYTAPGNLPGWPTYVEVPTKSSPLICELDGWTQRGREVVFGGETIYAFHGDGSEVSDGDRIDRTSGPFTIGGGGYEANEFWAKAAAGDIDRDGDVEVLAVAFNHTNDPTQYPDSRGELHCLGPGGRSPEWVRVFEPTCVAWTSPVLADLNGDQLSEVIYCTGGSIYALNANGSPWVYANQQTAELIDVLGSNLYQSPAVGDVDGDGFPDIVLATRTVDPKNGALWIVRPNGTPLTGFNGRRFSDMGTGASSASSTTGSPTLCDIDGEPGSEIFVVTTTRLWCIGHDQLFPVIWYYSFTTPFAMSGSHELLPEPALGDINRDGRIEVVLVDATSKLLVLDAQTGSMLSGYPLNLQLATGVKCGSCILANVDEDANAEILFGDSEGWVRGYRANGQIARGFPIYYGGNLGRQSLAVWDIDMNGHPDLVVQALDNQKMVAFDMMFATFPDDEDEVLRQFPWPMRRRDAANTGRLTEVPPVAVGLSFEAPLLGAGGEVVLTWLTSAQVSSFRVLRGPGGGEAAECVGEVPGETGGGMRRYVFRDHPPGPGDYLYQVVSVLPNGLQEAGPTREITVPGGSTQIAFGIGGLAPEPLPAGQSLRIACGLPGTGSTEAHLRIFDLQGRLVRTLFSGLQPAGLRLSEWDGRGEGGAPLAGGLYLLQLRMGAGLDTHRVLLIR